MSSLSRRRFVALAGSGIGAMLLSACSLTHAAERPEIEVQSAAIVPTPTPTPRPIPPRSKERVFLLPGTEWEAEGVAIHSGQAGPRVMILGGVHGNEPGGWEAAEAIATWQVERGSILVFPRVNWRSAAVMERTLPGIGDLNRLYPGDPSSIPMARMAAAIIEAGRAFAPELLFDLHESWVFYQERGSNSGTAFIGQTVSVGGGADDAAIDRISDVVRAVNAAITSREEFFMRGAARPRPGIQLVPNNPPPSSTPRPSATPPNGVTFSGTSSLSLGQWIPGCVPILIEMGQRDQAEARRSELHQMLVRTTLDQSGML